MRQWLILIGVALVAGCGVDGAPMRPEAHGRVTVGNQGVSAGGDLSLTNGTITLGVGL